MADIMHVQAVCATYECGISYESFPSEENVDVWILGKRYSSRNDSESLLNDCENCILLSYRKDFAPIGGIGPISDQGWGCMLRCGQMMMAQGLLCHHLGRAWRWQADSNNPTYQKLLTAFLDKKDSLYSIHQIAQMGVSEGKAIGQWFGPNTVAQVLKKLAKFDSWSNILVHVAMDSTIVKSDIKSECKRHHQQVVEGNCSCSCHICSDSNIASALHTTDTNTHTDSTDTCIHSNATISTKSPQAAAMNSLHQCSPPSNPAVVMTMAPCSECISQHQNSAQLWSPLLLFVPLRLGLHDLNEIYVNPLKACFSIHQSIGVIGGKPHHGYYFIGYHGDKLVYLDPHITYPTAIISTRGGFIPDSNYHCRTPSHMPFLNLDPSMALGFFCKDEAEFDDLCDKLKTLVIISQSTSLLEVVDERPFYWSPLADDDCRFPDSPGDGDDDYEILEEETDYI